MEELSTDYSVSENVKEEERLSSESFETESCAVTGGFLQPAMSQKCGTLIDREVIANRIFLIIICRFKNLKLMLFFFLYFASWICPQNLEGSTNHELIPIYCVYFCIIKYNYILDLKNVLLLFGIQG